MDSDDKSEDASSLVPTRGFSMPVSTKVVLDGDDSNGVFLREVRNAEISGVLRDSKTAPKCNVIEAAFQFFTADSVDFSRCDFKDNSIRSSTFRNSSFGYLTFAYNSVFDSRFELCSFPDTDIHNCEFYDTLFVECDFSHVLIKNCTFIGCGFRDCTTSNKVFETSRFGNCTFTNTELQIETIEDNYGITSKEYHALLRDDRVDSPHRKLGIEDLQELLAEPSRHPLKKLNLDYFIRATLLDGSPYLDNAVKLESWAPLFRTAGSFAVVLSQWVEFVLWVYERDALTVHTLICLQTMISGLLAQFEQEGHHSQALATIRGTHLSLARAVEGYLVTLQLCEQLIGRDITLIVEGGDSEGYYYRELALLFERSDAKITNLVPHNSPWELAISFAQSGEHYWFIALFLATRTEIELSRISQKMRVKASKLAKKGEQQVGPDTSNAEYPPQQESIFAFGAGIHAMPKHPTFSLAMRLPGNLVAELRLDVGSSQIAALRRTIKDML